MTLDNRTPQEVAYDATALSTRPDPTMGVDENIDELIDRFERLEAAYPEATPQQILAMAAEQDYDKRMAWAEVRTPLLTFPDGSIIEGTHGDNGEPWCVHLEAADGQFYAAEDGILSGDWGGHYFEELTLDQVEKLRALVNGPLITALIDAAKAWCKE